MKFLDISIFLVYLIVVLITGFWTSKKNKNKEINNKFTAGRSMRWLTIGISVMVTAFSSVNFLAMPSEVFSYGLYVMIAIPFFFISGIPVTRFLIPFFYKLKLISVYEYLGYRFSEKLRVFTAVLFIFWRFSWMAVALFAAGKMLHVITGISLPLVILLSGLCATTYTAFGGIQSVMRTDVVQFLVLFGAVISGLGYAIFTNPEGLSGVFADAGSRGLLKPIYPFDANFFSFNPFIRITFWSGIAGVFVAFTARYGVDQVVVQRFFTAKSIKDSIKGFWVNSILATFAIVLLILLGLAVNSYALQTGSLGRNWPALKQMAHLFSAMPTGMYGLIAAGIAAATMSSIDSGVNSCVTVWYLDVLKSKNYGNFRETIYSACFGFIATLIALSFIPVLGSHTSLFSMMNKIINGLGSPLLGIFTAGLFFRSVNSNGAFWGGMLGFTYSLYSAVFIKGLALHYYAFINFIFTVILMLAFSKLISSSERDKAKAKKWSYQFVMNS